MSSKSMSEKRHYCKTGILGAGLSGICTAIQLQLQLGTKDYLIFEENSDVGGVWLSNTYPGCASDIPTHFYSYSFSPKPDWSKFFCSQPEILQYLRHVAEKYDLYPNIRFSHRVKKAVWNEKISKWELLVSITSKEGVKNVEYILDDLIICIGVFRVPQIPPEFEDFEGPKMHSGNWDDGVELRGKNVAVIGTGASAVQIIPEIVNIVKTLTVYQRRPPWVLPRKQFEFPNWLNWAFANIPGVREVFRTTIFWLYEISHGIYIKGSRLSRLTEWIAKYHLRHQFQKDESTAERLTPNYLVGCKRITPSENYYPALAKPNVKIITASITKVKKGSIITEDENEEHFDVLILATGFKAQDYFSPLEILAKDSVDLLKLWKDEGPSTYLGICSAILPNAYFVIGPNSASGSTSGVFSAECQVNWIIQVLKEKERRGCKTVTVVKSAEEAHMEQVLSEMKSTVWAENCGSYYRDSRGVVTGMSGKSGFNVWRQLRSPNFNDLTFNY